MRSWWKLTRHPQNGVLLVNRPFGSVIGPKIRIRLRALV